MKAFVKLNNNAGILSSTGSITLKNQPNVLTTIQDIPDVDEVDVTTGATLVYNSVTDKYEIKLLSFTDVNGPLDCGTF
jgi:hypothetical protein